jgi:hypothetical protein
MTRQDLTRQGPISYDDDWGWSVYLETRTTCTNTSIINASVIHSSYSQVSPSLTPKEYLIPTTMVASNHDKKVYNNRGTYTNMKQLSMPHLGTLLTECESKRPIPLSSLQEGQGLVPIFVVSAKCAFSRCCHFASTYAHVVNHPEVGTATSLWQPSSRWVCRW